MVLVSRRLEDLKKSLGLGLGLGLGLEQKVLGLGLDGMVLIGLARSSESRLKSCNFQDLQFFY